MLTRRQFALGAALAPVAARAAEPLPLFDAHIHYSHDAWEQFPPAEAIGILRAAGLRGVLMSSSNDEGQQRLIALAPELIVSSLRPYRQRSDASSWTRDDGVIGYVEDRLARFRYAAIGEFHVQGADADLAVPRRLVALARSRGLVMHAHSNADAIERLFSQWPQARILWAHAGFEGVETIAATLRRHRTLWCDLSFRDPGSGGKVEPVWRELFTAFPDRFMVGTDTYTPERWRYVGEHARSARAWLADLPPALAERIAWRNAEALLRG
jgi:hypothetical protein